MPVASQPTIPQPKPDPEPTSRKFGKHLQKRQLDIPEYAASFVNYKALKKVPVPIRSVDDSTNTATAHQAAERYTNPPSPKCYKHCPRCP